MPTVTWYQTAHSSPFPSAVQGVRVAGALPTVTASGSCHGCPVPVSLPAVSSRPLVAPSYPSVMPAFHPRPSLVAPLMGFRPAAPYVIARPAVAPSSPAPPRSVPATGTDQDLQRQLNTYRQSGLKSVPVAAGLRALQQSAADGRLTREQFLACYQNLLRSYNVEVPSETVQQAVFDIFDRDGNGVVDLMEILCGISLLCAGTEEEKITAIFGAFDVNNDGFISLDEMFTFLTSVFRVGLTPQVLGVMNHMGTTVHCAEELACLTAIECFRAADCSRDGKLSAEEFKVWFNAPEHDPAFLFSPLRWNFQPAVS